MLRRFKRARRAVTWLAAIWCAPGCDDGSGRIDDLPGGDDVSPPVLQPRRQGFNLGAARGDVALLARGTQLYAVPLHADAPPARDGGLQCLKHPALRLWLPEGNAAAAIVEGPLRALSVRESAATEGTDAPTVRQSLGTRLTVIYDVERVRNQTTFDAPAPLAGVGQAYGSLYFLTRPHVAGAAVASSTQSHESDPASQADIISVEALLGDSAAPAAGASERTVLVLARQSERHTAISLPGQVFQARGVGDDLLLVVTGPAGRDVRAITPSAQPTRIDRTAESCGISVTLDGVCTFHGLGERGPRDCDLQPKPIATAPDAGDAAAPDAGDAAAPDAGDAAAPDAGDAAARAEDTGVGARRSALGAPPAACAVGWGSSSISDGGCVAGMVNTITGELFVVPLSGRDGCARVEPRSTAGESPELSPFGDFRFALSPLGRWAVVYPTRPSDVPVKIVSLVDGRVFRTAASRARDALFACDAQDNCTLWVLSDGSQSTPGVLAIAASSGATLLSCPSTVPLASATAGAGPALQLWARDRATWVGADSLGQQVLLQHADLSSASCLPLALDDLPVCIGALSSGQEYVCSANRDGDIATVGWGIRPTLTHHQHFGVDSRSSAVGCNP